jgi:hypothetical protein
MIRYVVVEVRGWFANRELVVDLTAFLPPDLEKKRIRSALTKRQLRDSPGLDLRKPVSRQQEVAMQNYFGWSTSWNDNRNAEFPLVHLPAGREFPVAPGEDPHLRSTEDVTGYHVFAGNSEVGRLEDFIMPDESFGRIAYLDVKTGNWLRHRSMLIPTGSVMSVTWAHHWIILRHDARDRVGSLLAG